MRLRVIVLLMAGVAAGCYRTHYVNLQPAGDERPDAAISRADESGWQHFFLFGWFPDERRYPANELCENGALVREVHTQRTFMQGVATALSSYYVNIYSPYYLDVFCQEPPAPDLDNTAQAPEPSGAEH
jgi:hypothetical protein